MADLFVVLSSLILLLVFILYYFSTRKFNYWKQKNVPHPQPTPLLGNYGDYILIKRQISAVVQSICEKYPDAPFIGAYYGTEPVLIPKDPEIIKLIVTKDFYYFHGRELSDHTDKEAVGLNLFATHGDKWKVLRQNMTPLFSSAKMRNMFHLIQKCSYSFENLLDEELKISQNQEVRSLAARFTIECIGACAFGVDTDTMGNDQNNPFKKVGNTLSNFPKSLTVKRTIRAIWPSIFYGLGFKLISNEFDLFKRLVMSVFSQREYKPSARNDFIDLILSWKESHSIVGDSMRSSKTGDGTKVTLVADDELLLAQCFVFFTAGFETSATTLGHTLFELAKNEDIQKRVFKEVDEYLSRHQNKVNYDVVSELPYLDACIDEALRLYPILGVILRELMEDYTLPGGVRINKGMRVHLPVYYLHHNEKFYPEPEKFRPERFYGDEKRKVNPYTYLPFGEGPRSCIGTRFAKMQMLTGLVTILKKYKLELAENMPSTLEFKPEYFTIKSKDNITLRFVERDGWVTRKFAK